MTKTALITGITGQDGAYLAELLLDKGYIVHGIKRRASLFNTDRVDHLYQEPGIEHARFKLHYGDLTDSTNLIRIVQQVQPDEIYNLGAMSHVAVSFEQPEYTADADGVGTLRLLEAIRILGLEKKTRFYQASTSELYGLVQETPQKETTPFYPRSPYAVAKLYAYWITVNYREAYGLYACNGILFNHESPLRGESFVTRKITRALARIALGLQDCLELGNLSALRDWGHARDFVRAAAAVLGVEIEFKGKGKDEIGVVAGVSRSEGEQRALQGGRRHRACRAALFPPHRSRDIAGRPQQGAREAGLLAGHRGLVGSAILRRLLSAGHTQLITRTHAELDLTDARATEAFFAAERPEFVFLAAAKVGGIVANNSFPAEFIRDNLAIQTSVIHAAYLAGVQRLLFLGSSCIYPKLAPQPMREHDLLTGALEPTNRPYALAKIAGIEMCWSYNRQYGTRYLAAMPTNLYGPGDNYHPTNSHVIPALLRRFHEAKERGDTVVTVWGSGTPRREFLYSEDMADACVFLMNLPEGRFAALLGSDESVSGRFEPPLVNIGVGEDVSIAELARLVAAAVGYAGAIEYDASKPDGTPRKLMDVSRLGAAGWKARTRLEDGLRKAYAAFVVQHTT